MTNCARVKYQAEVINVSMQPAIEPCPPLPLIRISLPLTCLVLRFVRGRISTTPINDLQIRTPPTGHSCEDELISSGSLTVPGSDLIHFC